MRLGLLGLHALLALTGWVARACRCSQGASDYCVVRLPRRSRKAVEACCVWGIMHVALRQSGIVDPARWQRACPAPTPNPGRSYLAIAPHGVHCMHGGRSIM